MKILANKSVNLHSPSAPGGILSIPAGTSAAVPDDVAAHPGFTMLVNSGHVVRLADDAQVASAPNPVALQSGVPVLQTGATYPGPTEDDGVSGRKGARAETPVPDAADLHAEAVKSNAAEGHVEADLNTNDQSTTSAIDAGANAKSEQKAQDTKSAKDQQQQKDHQKASK